MKLINDEDRQELLADIFASEESARTVRAEDVLRIVHAARVERQRRRRFSAGAALVLMSALGATLLVSSRPRDVARNVPTRAPEAEAKAQASVDPPEVKHVDDEGMLAQLGGQPAALVRWPDGRKSLLLLVDRPSRQ